MKSRFVRLYLLVAGSVLAVTALTKLPAIFHPPTACIEDPILGDFQPNISNEQLLGIAAGAEFTVVLLICFSRWPWLPCLATAMWGSGCVAARWFLMDPLADCHCLGWLAEPGQMTNVTVGLLALAIAIGGWLAFVTALRNTEPLEGVLKRKTH